MLAMDVHSYNSLVEVRVRGLNDGVVHMVDISKGVEALEDELEERVR